MLWIERNVSQTVFDLDNFIQQHHFFWILNIFQTFFVLFDQLYHCSFHELLLGLFLSFALTIKQCLFFIALTIPMSLAHVLTIICDVLPSSLCLSHSPWRTPKSWADVTWDKVKHIVILGDKSGIKEKITFGWKKVGKTCSQIRSTLTSFRCGVLAFLSPPAGGKISLVGIFRLS